MRDFAMRRELFAIFPLKGTWLHAKTTQHNVFAVLRVSEIWGGIFLAKCWRQNPNNLRISEYAGGAFMRALGVRYSTSLLAISAIA